MNEFKSWQSYWVFQRIVKAKNRYFRDKDTEQFLKTVLSTSENRKLDLPKERYLWRAQLGHHWQPVHQDDEYVADIPTPFPPNRMKPLLHEAAEGRVFHTFILLRQKKQLWLRYGRGLVLRFPSGNSKQRKTWF